MRRGTALCFFAALVLGAFGQANPCSLLCNGDFEDAPVTVPGGCALVDQSEVPCWNTTSSDQIMEVWGTGFNGVPAYSGDQFIEMNAYTVATINQDFQAIPGSTVDISFAHRGRNGVDVMSVGIGPPGGPYADLGTFSTSNTAWQLYTVSYTFPSTSQVEYSLRFNSISAAGGNPSVGNFLDAVSITLPAIVLDVQVWSPDCPGDTGGSAEVTASGGSPPYTIAWAAPLSTGTFTVNGLGAGLYPFTVTDGYGCAETGEAVLTAQYATEQTSAILAICNGRSAVLPGGELTEMAGTYLDTLQTVHGCDSIITTQVSVLPVFSTTMDATVCGGAAYTLPGGSVATTAGTYMDTLQAMNGCDSIVTTQLAVLPVPTVNFTVDSVCFGLPNQFTDLSQGTAAYPIDQWDWVFGDGQTSTAQHPAVLFPWPGTYAGLLTVTNSAGCSADTSLSLAVANPLPAADFTTDPVSATEASPVFHLVDLSTGATAQYWEFLNGGDTSTLAEPSLDLMGHGIGEYDACLWVWNEQGCVDSTCKVLVVTPEPMVFVPNAFTPNKDGVNDRFVPVITDVPYRDYLFQVFDRWGELVFGTKDPALGWNGSRNGTLLQEGVYVWKLRLKFDAKDRSDHFTGHVLMLR